MFELSKKILKKVSFDKALFRKELVKSFKWLPKNERLVLMLWCMSTFKDYTDVILEVYQTVSMS